MTRRAQGANVDRGRFARFWTDRGANMKSPARGVARSDKGRMTRDQAGARMAREERGLAYSAYWSQLPKGDMARGSQLVVLEECSMIYTLIVKL